MELSTLLFVVLIAMLVGALPSWPYSRAWGYYPSSFFGLVLIIMLIMAVAGQL
jgi:hypothetical protein